MSVGASLMTSWELTPSEATKQLLLLLKANHWYVVQGSACTTLHDIITRMKLKCPAVSPKQGEVCQPNQTSRGQTSISRTAKAPIYILNLCFHPSDAQYFHEVRQLQEEALEPLLFVYCSTGRCSCFSPGSREMTYNLTTLCKDFDRISGFTELQHNAVSGRWNSFPSTGWNPTRLPLV